MRSLLEDSKGNFWVGTAGDGLHIMNREKGTFTHFYYDSTHPEKLSRPPVYRKPSSDHITFIKEDGEGTIWIGTLGQGINQYDPATGKLTHHGSFVQNNDVRSFQDTASGFSFLTTTYALVTKAGLLWTCNTFGSLFAVNPSRTVIPHFLTSKYNTTSTLSANSFYKENKDVLWIATDTGLLRKDLNAGAEKRFIHRAGEPDALNRNIMATMRRDKEGNFWLGTNAGLEMFNPVTSQFTGYRHDTKSPHSLSDDVIYGLCLDANQNLWVATVSGGLDMLDRTTGQFVHHKHNDSDSNSLSSNHTVCVAEGPDRTLWVGTDKGVNKLDRKTGRFQHYLETTIIKAVFVDAASDVWAGSAEGLFRYNKRENAFEVFEDPDTKFKVNLVLHILEDNDKNLWISTTDNIARIDAGRKRVNVFGAAYGVQHSYFAFGDNSKTSEGEILIGDERGYYVFLPSQVKAQSTPAQVNLTDLWLSDKKITPGPEAILKAPLFLTTELTLPSKQNSFAIEFSTVNLNSPGNVKILYRLENYDNIWQGSRRAAEGLFLQRTARKVCFSCAGGE